MSCHETTKELLLAPVKFLLLILFCLILLPTLLPFCLVHAVYRQCLRLLVTVGSGPNKLTPVENMDALWMQDTPENPAVISGVISLIGRPQLDRLRSVVGQRLTLAIETGGPEIEKFRRRIVKRRRCLAWLEDPDFCVDNHVTEWTGQVPANETELRCLLSELCSRPLPTSRSPWQLMLVPGVGGNGCCLLFRCHHVIGDGASLTTLVLGYLVDPTSDESPRPRGFGPSGGVGRVVRAVLDAPMLLLQELLGRSDESMLHGPAVTGAKKLAWVSGIQLDRVKRLKEMTGSTVNDVLMSCLASAFRRYCQRCGGQMPDRLKAYVPIDMRGPAAIRNDSKLDNQFSLIFMPLPLQESDPLLTLRSTQRNMNAIKRSSFPLVNYVTMKVCMAHLPLWLSRLIFEILAKKSSLVLSNVPGPQHRLNIDECEIEALWFWVPSRANIGVGVSIFSYNGQVAIGITADSGVMDEPQQLANDFKVCLDQLERACRQLKSQQ